MVKLKYIGNHRPISLVIDVPQKKVKDIIENDNFILHRDDSVIKILKFVSIESKGKKIIKYDSFISERDKMKCNSKGSLLLCADIETLIKGKKQISGKEYDTLYRKYIGDMR